MRARERQVPRVNLVESYHNLTEPKSSTLKAFVPFRRPPVSAPPARTSSIPFPLRGGKTLSRRVLPDAVAILATHWHDVGRASARLMLYVDLFKGDRNSS